ncbi:cyclic pyranopterin monophosphate synthase MoaC [Frigoribacterium sp. PvP032]|uniref:cyclic pyranopterin monophosphate synthase MoaC n=1 Tax=Frigoribacterium sp. PvP032 TaxID=2806589 RepID=UPI001AE6C472|nr:cyclic pyranopterin monophosphate synthase MoaC [Frigoribacterium sp. PvP032]MBP1191516.1 cyclic pyranopterin phosphate synthase [Frigoribacterium sp. PvP032]
MSDDAHGAPPASTGQQPVGDLTHVRADGSAHMVDVTGKAETSREAAAQAVLTTRPDVVARLVDGTLPKGEALGTARIAGIMAAKQTPALIPLCHPLPLGAITVDFETDAGAETGAEEASVTVVARVRTRGVTGVEMEALTAATVAALTLFDMIKAVDHLAVIGDVKVLQKSGGKSGAWAR